MAVRLPGLVSGLILAVWAMTAHGEKPISSVIDPELGVYGVSFGSTEKQLTDALGPPTGEVQLSSLRRALIYGRKHTFVFRNGQLRELVVANHVLDYHLDPDPHPVVDSINWTLGPGIKDGMSYAQVTKQLGRPASNGDYRLEYETADARVEMQFSGSGPLGARGDPESFRLIGFVLESTR